MSFIARIFGGGGGRAPAPIVIQAPRREDVAAQVEGRRRRGAARTRTVLTPPDAREFFARRGALRKTLGSD